MSDVLYAIADDTMKKNIAVNLSEIYVHGILEHIVTHRDVHSANVITLDHTLPLNGAPYGTIWHLYQPAAHHQPTRRESALKR